MLAAMLDSATDNAVMARLSSHLTAVTIRLDTSFLKPAALGSMIATARLFIKMSARLK
jgi:acyl-coenzyme A thioesterase PaaI-like protein